jgi:hypothetical protein
MHNNALIRFSREFDIPLNSPEITTRLIEEINKLKRSEKDEKEKSRKKY